MTTIKQELAIPLMPRFAILLLVGFTIYVELIYPHGWNSDFIFGLIVKTLFFVILALTLLTTRYQLDFDYKKRTCFKYLWILGFKRGASKKFNNIEKIFINTVRYSPAGYLRFLPTFPDANPIENSHKSFLKFDDGEKLVLLEMHSKEKLIAKLKELNKELKTKIYDSTSGVSILIDEY